MGRTKDETAKELAEWHGRVEPDLQCVIRIIGDREDDPREPIKLLEINAATPATGSVEPFAFAPQGSVAFPTVVAEVTPDEFERIKNRALELPKGWSLDRMKTLFVRSAA
jgi:hypothetical protein